MTPQQLGGQKSGALTRQRNAEYRAARDAKYRAAWHEGITADELAKVVGLKPRTVAIHCRELRLPLRPAVQATKYDESALDLAKQWASRPFV
jgi:hypothetical protein